MTCWLLETYTEYGPTTDAVLCTNISTVILLRNRVVIFLLVNCFTSKIKFTVITSKKTILLVNKFRGKMLFLGIV